MSTTTSTPPPVPLGKALVRHSLIALAILVMMLVPMAVLLVITGQPVATYSAMGTIIGIVAVVAGGLRIGLITVIVAALLAPLAIVAGLSPLTGAALMAIMTLVVGRMSLFGLHKAVLLVPIFLAWPMLSPTPWLPLDLLDRINALMAKHGMNLADALNHAHREAHAQTTTSGPLKRIIGNALMEQRFDTAYLTWVLVIFLVGGLVPVIILPFALRKMHRPKPKTHPRAEALPYTITITVLTAVAMYWFLDHPKQVAGSFLIATILVLTQIDGDIEWRLTIQRVLGTLAGVIAFIAVTNAIGETTYTEVLGLPFPVHLYAVGLIFGVFAIIAKFGKRQWMYYILIVPCATSLNAFTFNQAADVGEQRLVDNVVGAALVIAATLITLGASRLVARRESGDPPPGAAPA